MFVLKESPLILRRRLRWFQIT
ncbi:hypothetical protein Goshw_024461 [Gossypium schwendimanii]|uniref:Uncharacterized protein n=1 Tax=Gossypium schwendimanii TaxID=34291 RepID=A0A7J9LR15_GOSSC|nr:hypothetical protein [Gossypium schwendimanii]